jgi:hypothetical protein
MLELLEQQEPTSLQGLSSGMSRGFSSVREIMSGNKEMKIFRNTSRKKSTGTSRCSPFSGPLEEW